MMAVVVGNVAPNFVLPASNGEVVQLSDFAGRNILLYFYPKDLTQACSVQACDLRDQHTNFSDLNTVILGISTDSIARHEKFINKYNLPFLLLADEDHKVSEQYGVWQQKSMYGKQFMGIVRSTFLIDTKRIVRKEWRKVRVKGHIEAVKQALLVI
jgi:peroxiredoxin Q/BCP